MVRKEYKKITDFTMEQLLIIRSTIKSAKTIEELLGTIDNVIQDKVASSKDMNSRFPIDWMNIDAQYLELLHNNQIETLAQLREIDDLRMIPGITKHGIEQISWARDFFDMSDLENMSMETEADQLEVAKVIVKHAKEVSRNNHSKK